MAVPDKKKPFTEKDWTNPNSKSASAYVLSKTLAEKAAWEFAGKTDIKLSTINPGLVLGPVLDPRHGTSVELIKRMLSGSMPAAPDFGFNVVDVRDVAAAHIAAFEKPAAIGKRFICCDKWMLLKQVGQFIKSEFPKEGRKAPAKSMPSFMVWLASIFDKSLKQILPELGQHRAADNTQLRNILGITPITAETSIRATVQSLITHGTLKK